MKTEGKIMKKILFATTALVATASVAAADVTFSGYGRFGVTYDETRDTAATPTQNTQLDHRVRLIINAGAESDNGMTFNAQTRLQWDDVAQGPEDTAGANNGATRGAVITVTKDALSLNIGNYSLAEAAGASYWMGGLGYTGFIYANPRAANGDVTTGNWAGAGDTQVAVQYSNSGFGVGIATSDDGAGIDRNVLTLNYDLGGYGLGLTHQASNAAADAFDYTAVSITGKVAGASFGLYADDYADGTSAFGVSVGYDIAASTSITLIANTLDNNVAGDDDETIGLSLNHDLGGGVSFGGGVAQVNGLTNAEAGIVFNF